MEYTTEKLHGFGNRVHVLTKDYTFNGYTLKKGLRTDGGSVPKMFIIGLFLIYNAYYGFDWFTSLVIYAIAIDESNGWFQKCFFAHDQRWKDGEGFFRSNWQFYQDMLYKVINYENNCLLKHLYHIPLGFILAIIYPLAVTSFGWWIYYFKYKKQYRL